MQEFPKTKYDFYDLLNYFEVYYVYFFHNKEVNQCEIFTCLDIFQINNLNCSHRLNDEHLHDCQIIFNSKMALNYLFHILILEA